MVKLRLYDADYYTTSWWFNFYGSLPHKLKNSYMDEFVPWVNDILRPYNASYINDDITYIKFNDETSMVEFLVKWG